jgi:hypothetical protein
VSPAQAATAPTPVRHVVILLEENHSFDNVLGPYCAEVDAGQRARSGLDKDCDGATTGRTTTGQVVPLTSAPDIVPAAKHTPQGQVQDIAGGKMDGFNLDPDCSLVLANCYNAYTPTTGPCAVGSCIPNVVTLADHYALSDRTFELAATPSWLGHLVFATADGDGFEGTIPKRYVAGPAPKACGPGWGCDSGFATPWSPDHLLVPSCVPDAAGGLGPNWAGYTGPTAPHEATIFDELDHAGLSWRIYGGEGAPVVQHGFGPDGWGWTICPSFAECLYSAQRQNLVAAQNVVTDAAAGTLPAFSIVTPTAPNSEHNADAMSQGDDWIGQVVGAIQHGPRWGSTVVFVTWDDCGCFFDHVNPLAFGATWGLRVPLLIVSPFAKPGATDSQPTTFAGLLAYAEHVFGLPPLSTADASAYDYAQDFCYQPSRGCTQAGTAPVSFVDQAVAPMTPAQQAAARAAERDDT